MITKKFSLRRRLMSGHVVPWTLYHSGQWGTGTTKTISVSMTEGQAIQFKYVFHPDDNTNTYNRDVRYGLYNGSTNIYSEDTEIYRGDAKTIYAPGNVTKASITSKVPTISGYSTTMKVDAYYRVIK